MGWLMKTVLALSSVLFLGAMPAWAALGESANSVRLDAQQFRGEVRTTTAQGYSVQEIRSPDGTVIREYVSPSGVVFGIGWEGPTVPNMSQLLGAYFPEFQQAARARGHRRGPLMLHTEHLVVEAGGHMRAFYGRVYLPSSLPNSVSEAVVK